MPEPKWTGMPANSHHEKASEPKPNRFLESNENDKNLEGEDSGERLAGWQREIERQDAENILSLQRQIADFPDREQQLRDSESLERKKFIESAGATAINTVLAYVKFDSKLYLHIPPSKTIPLSEKLRLWREGLEQTAQLVSQDESVETIEGVSWIVGEHEKWVKKLGFEIQDPGRIERVANWIANRFRKKEKKLDKRMVMKREEFLNKYLKSRSE